MNRSGCGRTARGSSRGLSGCLGVALASRATPPGGGATAVELPLATAAEEAAAERVRANVRVLRQGGRVTARDRTRERTFLDHAAAPHGRAGDRWAACARGRLEAGQVAYGDRWPVVGLARLLEKLGEEAADLGAWAALATQALDLADLRPARAVEVHRVLASAARAGAVLAWRER